jgi:hypothetical protein
VKYLSRDLVSTLFNGFTFEHQHGRTSVASAGRAGATDDHCDRIVDAVREVFDEGRAFRTDPHYRISSDEQGSANVAGGRKPGATNVNILGRAGIPDATKVTRALHRKYLMKFEGVLKGKSQAYYEQMKGRHIRYNKLSVSKYQEINC